MFGNDDNSGLFGGSIMGQVAREQRFGADLNVGADSFGNRTETVRNPFGVSDTHVRTFADGSTETKTGLNGW